MKKKVKTYGRVEDYNFPNITASLDYYMGSKRHKKQLQKKHPDWF